MDDIGGIEYLEEYEDLIMPGSTGEKRTVEDDESSSSIDQDIFESLFDDQSDDESEPLPKKIQQNKQRLERESLDSLDMLVRDLGEQVNPLHEQSSSKSISNSSQIIGMSKPITPCLKKSSDGRGTSQDKPQKRVMFALPTVRRSSSSSSLTSKNYQGRKLTETSESESNFSESSKSSQRKLNRPPLTIVRPEKVQFKDPVEDPLSLDKNDSDLDSVSDISDDSFASLSEIFVTPSDGLNLQANTSHTQNTDSPEISSKTESSFARSPPVHIPTDDLPEKVTIISDTVLTRIDTALLESLATDDSKEVFSRDQKIITDNENKFKENLNSAENQNTDILNKNVDPSSEGILADNCVSKSLTEVTETPSELKKLEQLSLSENCKEMTTHNSIPDFEQKSGDLLQNQGEESIDKDKMTSRDNLKDVERSEKLKTNIMDEKDRSGDINSNTSDLSQSIPIQNKHSKEYKGVECMDVDITEKESEPDSTKKEGSEQSSISEETKNDDTVANESQKITNLEGITEEPKKSTNLSSHENKNEVQIHCETSKKEYTDNKKSAPKKVDSAGGQTETQTKEQKNKQTTSKSVEKATAKASSPQKPKDIAPHSQSKEQRNTGSKPKLKTTVTQSPKTTDLKTDRPSASKSTSEISKKDNQKPDIKQQNANDKTEKEKVTTKEKDCNKSNKTTEKKDSSTTKAPSKGQNTHTSSNRISNAGPSLQHKDRTADIVNREEVKTPQKTEKTTNALSRQNSDMHKDTKKLNERATSTTGELKIKYPTISKEKQSSSTPQKTSSQDVRNIEKTKDSPSMSVSEEKKRDESKDVSSKELEDSQKSKDSSKEMGKKSLQSKAVEPRKSINSGSKIRSSKEQKDVQISGKSNNLDNTKEQKEPDSSKDSSKEQKKAELIKDNNKERKYSESSKEGSKERKEVEWSKPKKAADSSKLKNEEGLKNDVKISTTPNKTSDMKSSQFNLQKNDKRIQNKECKVNSEAKSLESSYDEKSSSKGDSIEKNIIKPLRPASSPLNTSSDQNKRKPGRSTLKRENSTISVDNNSAKKSKMTASSNKNDNKTNSPNKSFASGSHKNEESSQAVKSNASVQKSIKSNSIKEGANTSKTLTSSIKSQKEEALKQPKESTEIQVKSQEKNAVSSAKNDLTTSSRIEKSQSSASSIIPTKEKPKGNDLGTSSALVASDAKKPKELIKKIDKTKKPTPTKHIQTSNEPPNEPNNKKDEVPKNPTSISSLLPSSTSEKGKEPGQLAGASKSSLAQRNSQEKKQQPTKEVSTTDATKNNFESKTTSKERSDHKTGESKSMKLNNDQDKDEQGNKTKILSKDKNISIKKSEAVEKCSKTAGHRANQPHESELNENPESAKKFDQLVDSTNDANKELKDNVHSKEDSSNEMTKSPNSFINLPNLSETKADNYQQKPENQSTENSVIESKEATFSSTENPNESLNAENQESGAKDEKSETIVSSSCPTQGVVKRRRRRKKASLPGWENNSETREQDPNNISMEIGTRRNLRKRGLDTTPENDTATKITKEQINDITPENEKPNKDVSPKVGEDYKKEVPQRKDRRGFAAQIEETISNSLGKEAESDSNVQGTNLEKSEKIISSDIKPNEKTEPINKSSLTEKQQDLHLPLKLGKKTEEKIPEDVSTTESQKLRSLRTENRNELISDSKLDSLSTTSVESAVFSGFNDLPENVVNNENLDEASVTSPSTNNLTFEPSKEQSVSENKEPSPKRLKSSPPKPVTSVVITFKEWLATKNIGQSASEQDTANRDNNKTLETSEKKDDTNEKRNEDEGANQNNEIHTTEPSESADISLTISKPQHKKKKNEIDVLRESMSKEMLESGIDELILSHSSSSRCLTKRSVAAVINKNRIGTRTCLKAGQEKQLPQVRRMDQFSSPTQSAVVSPVNITAISNAEKPSSIKKQLKHLNRGSLSPKSASLPVGCRNLRVRLSRSFVSLYLKTLKEEIPNSTPSTTKNQQSFRAGRKRKATTRTSGPTAKKASIFTTVEQSTAKSVAGATVIQPLTEQESTSQPHSARTSSRSRASKGSPRIGTVPTTSPQTRTGAVDPKTLSQTLITSPIKSTSGNVPDLLMPISEAPTLLTQTDSSRRAKSKRSASLTNTTTTTSMSTSGKTSTVPCLTLPTTIETQASQAKPPVAVQEPTPTIHSNVAPKTECVDEYDSTYGPENQQNLTQENQKTTFTSLAPPSSVVSPSPSIDTRAQSSTLPNSVPLVISGATSHSLPPIVIDNAGTRIYSFLHPTKYNNSHGYVMLDYCCPNLDGPMTAIDPTRRHAKVDAAVRELPAYITMETRLVTRAELEADSNALPASIRHKVQRITGGNSVPPKVPNTTVATSLTSSINLTSANVTITTAAAPMATTASVPAGTTSSSSSMSAPLTMSASVSALQKQLPATTTLTPKTISPNTNSPMYKTTSGNGNSTPVASVTAPTATITPTSLADMREKLRNNLKKYDVLLKKHYPRVSLLTFPQRQEIIESLANATQLLPRDVENATRLLQEYVTHMALKTATKSQNNSDMSNHAAPVAASAGLRNIPTTTVASTVTAGSSGSVMQQQPPVTTRAHSKRNSSSSNMQRKSVPIYNSDKTIIGYQVQMVSSANTKSITPVSGSASFSTSTRRFTKNSNNPTPSGSTTSTRRSGVFVIDKMNMSAPASNCMPLYQKHDVRTPTSISAAAHIPQASSTPISSSGSVITRSGGTSRMNRGAPVRQLPPRATTAKIHSPAATTTQAPSLPRLPTLTRNPHLPPLTPPTTVPTTRSTPVGIEQMTIQKRLTRKTAAASSSLAEILVVSHKFDGNPMPANEESILPDANTTASTALIKSEKPDEF